MATRDRTALFLRYREDARSLHRRQPSSTAHKRADDDLSDGDDVETARLTAPPDPDWLHAYNDLKGDLSELQSMLDALAALYARHLLPSFGDADTTQLERDIRTASHRLTGLLHAAEQKVRALCAPKHAARPPRQSGAAADGVQQQQEHAKNVELTIRRNLQKRFATPLQELSQGFRKRQKAYLDKLNEMREADPPPDRASGAPSRAPGSASAAQSFAAAMAADPGLGGAGGRDRRFDDGDGGGPDSFGGGAQLQEVEHASSVARERRQELERVTHNINDLATLVKDLAALVVDQGTVLDRVDYNVEEVKVRTFAATRELRIADRYQRKRHAVCLIIILSIACGVMGIILIHKWTS